MALGFGPPNQLNFFEMKELLGRGGFGAVYSFKDKRTDQVVAIKVISIAYDQHDENLVRREVSMQRQILNHANIVKYHDCWKQDFSSMPYQIQREVCSTVRRRNIKTVFCFKMALYDCSLRDWLKKRNVEFFADETNQNSKIPIRDEGKKGYSMGYLSQILKYFKQILSAVEYYQSFNPPVMHQHLEPRNILYDKTKDSFLISDFGLGRVYSDDDRSLTRGLGYALYAAPEQLDERYYTISVDYYPLGIILFEMLFPLQEEEDFLEEKLYLLNRGNTDTACEIMYHSLPELCSLITRMMSRAESRPKLDEIIRMIDLEIEKAGVVNDRLKFFEMKERLGQGGCGIVYRFKESRTDREVAIKILPIIPHRYEMVQREVSMQRQILNHANIVKYHDCWEQRFYSIPNGIQKEAQKLVQRSNISEVICIKMNLYDRSLKDWLRKRNEEFFANESNRNATFAIRKEGKKGYSMGYLSQILKYFKQILSAVEYYQSFNPPFMHRDLKPGNILYDKSNDSFLISDFGLGQVYDSSLSFNRRVGTTLYAAPEQLGEGKYDTSVDYYPLGIILFEILFPLQNEYDFLNEKLELLKGGDTATACEAMYHSLPGLCNLITRMVSLAESRPELSEIIRIIDSEIRKTNSVGNHLKFFEMEKYLGVGGYGTVYKFKDSRNDQEVAIKILFITYDPHELEMVKRETSIQCHKLDHANIVKYHDCWEQKFSYIPDDIQNMATKIVKGRNIKTVFCFKMDLYDCSLRDWLKERNVEFFADESNQNEIFPIRNEGRKGYTREYLNGILKYFRQILSAVEYYQSFDPPVMHRDLKPENILYDKSNDSFLISDFGLGRVYSESQSLSHGIGTWLYAAPEQLVDYLDYTIAVDYYPLGLILYGILFPVKNEEEYKQKLYRLRNNQTATACEAMCDSLPEIYDLITKMLQLEDSRPTLNEIIRVIDSEIEKTGGA